MRTDPIPSLLTNIPKPPGTRLGADFFQRDPVTCARELIGYELVWRSCGGIIVETEAYSVRGDEACHTFSRPSSRAFVELHPPGTAYVYLNYGVHWLLNFLVKGGREDGFVLIRALEPTRGIARMQTRRGTRAGLCSGPGRLTKALGIDKAQHGRDCLGGRSLEILRPATAPRIAAGTRIGISKAAHLPWRFVLEGSACLSAPLRG
ncbi:MAG: DNA-3-methyladenine glycosylase [Verrucomicrobiae bacterium]